MGRIEIEAPERFYAVDFSASLVEDSEADPFRAGLIHPLPTELASVGSTRLRGQGVDKSGVVTLTKSGQACPLDFGAKTLERKLDSFKAYYNASRTHRALDGRPPLEAPKQRHGLGPMRWQPHCRGLYQLPIPA